MRGGMHSRVCVWQGACMVGGMHGRGRMHGRGACMAGVCAWQEGHVWQGGICGMGHAWQGACVAWGSAWQGDMYVRGHVWQGGMCGGACFAGVCVAGGVHGRGHA